MLGDNMQRGEKELALLNDAVQVRVGRRKRHCYIMRQLTVVLTEGMYKNIT